MPRLSVYDLLRRRVLVTREEAQALGVALEAAMGQEQGSVSLDFAGVEGLTPSFVDELLGVLAACSAKAPDRPRDFVFINAPTRLSLKFTSAGKGRGFRITEVQSGTWHIEEDGAAAASQRSQGRRQGLP